MRHVGAGAVEYRGDILRGLRRRTTNLGNSYADAVEVCSQRCQGQAGRSTSGENVSTWHSRCPRRGTRAKSAAPQVVFSNGFTELLNVNTPRLVADDRAV